MSNSTGESPPHSLPETTDGADPNILPLRLHLWAAVFWLVVGLAAGLTYALQFVPALGAALIPPNSVHSPGRLRMAHTGIMIYGFLLNALLAGVYGYGARGPSRFRFGGWVCSVVAILFQLAILLGSFGALHGSGWSTPWGEFSMWDDLVIISALAFALIAVRPAEGVDPILGSLIRVGLMGGIFAFFQLLSTKLLLDFSIFEDHFHPTIVKEFPPPLFLTAFQARITDGCLLPVALCLLRGLIVLGRGKPAEDRLFFGCGIALMIALSPWTAVRSLSPNPLPFPDDLAEWTASLGYPAGIILVLLSLWRGAFKRDPSSGKFAVPPRWHILASCSLLIYSIDRWALLFPRFREAIQFTDWTVAHHHLLFVGILSATAFATIDFFAPLVRGAWLWRHEILARYHFGLTAFGLALMVLSLEIAGWTQSQLADSMVPWNDLLVASRPFWVLRIGAGVCMAFAQCFLLANLFLTGSVKAAILEWNLVVVREARPRILRRALLLSLLVPAYFAATILRQPYVYVRENSAYGGEGYIKLLQKIASWPRDESGRHVAPRTRSFRTSIPTEYFDLTERDYFKAFDESTSFQVGPPDIPQRKVIHVWPGEDSYTRALLLGVRVYVAEGCFHCHTQYIRKGTPDVERWGGPPMPDHGFGSMMGVRIPGFRRVGPDLTYEANRRSNDWHAAHLYKPSSIVADSIMPAYPWLFEKRDGKIEPNREGLALIVYLQSLGAEVDQDRR